VIQLPRLFFRQLRTVLRRSISRVSAPVVFHSSPHSLSVRCQQDGIAIEYGSEDGRDADHFAVPFQALADLEGKGQDLVTLDVTKAGKVEAQYRDAGVPRVLEYESAKLDTLPPFPERPARFVPQDTGLLKALDDAMQSASNDTVRFALNKIQIRGGTGVIVATDGRAMLWQNGFTFPWTEDVLVPRTSVFGCKELGESIKIAKTKTHVCFECGPWAIFFQIDKEGRFPKVEGIIPSNLSNATHLNLTAEDAAFLSRALPRLPGDHDDHAPVTLDLNGEAIVRARAEGQDKSTAVVLAGSNVTGKAIRIAADRHLLARAIELGFTEAHFISVETPLLFQDQRRKFVVMGLGKDAALAPKENDLRLSSDVGKSTDNHQPIPERKEPMKTSRSTPAPLPAETNGNGHDTGTNGNGQHQQHGTFAALLQECESIQSGLRDLQARTNHLMGGLKAYRRHAKTMQSTLASLRQLQQVDAIQ
jgi:hypothetical protein